MGNAYIRSKSITTYSIEGHEAYIVKSPLFHNPRFRVGYNGYILFKESPTKEQGRGGILTYVPVHGGITYCQTDELGKLYGFDTCHSDSGDYPIRDLDWIKEQISIMYRGILLAAKLEEEYLAASTNDQKLKILEPLTNQLTSFSFGVCLKCLSGEL